MDLNDERYDPTYQKMVAAFHGDAEVWSAINRDLRDAMVDFAISHCPYYAERIDRKTTFEDIAILTKEDIRRNTEDLLATGVSADRRLQLSTSGSTGEPLAFYRDLSQGAAEMISARRFLQRLHGVPEEAMTVWVQRSPPPWPRVHPLPTPELTPERLAEDVPVWMSFDSYWLYGNASAIDWIAEEIDRQGIRLPRKPACVVTTADQLTDQGLDRISRVFGRPVHSWYGSHEFNGYLAGTLPGTRRYAFNPLLAYVEVVGDDDRPVAPAGSGRLIVTDLNNYVMPFIRYDTGDVATTSREGFQGGFLLIQSIEGRSAEILRFPSGRFMSGIMLGQALRDADAFEPVRFYQCAQTGPNELELRVVWRSAPDEASRAKMISVLREFADPGFDVRVRDVEDLETLPSGKRWIVKREF